jgi:hypothetical protein
MTEAEKLKFEAKYAGYYIARVRVDLCLKDVKTRRKAMANSLNIYKQKTKIFI